VEPEAGTAWPAADSHDAAATADAAGRTGAGPVNADAGQAESTRTWHSSRDDETPAHPTPAGRFERPPSEAEAFDDAGTSATAPPAVGAHSVPPTNVAESTRCPRCGTENRPGLAFCSNCGQRLVAAGISATVERPGTPEGTQACPRCGTHNRAGVAFCQNCGANLRAATAPAGYVPPAVAADDATSAAPDEDTRRRGAILGPIVLLIGAVGIAVGWLLPFPYGADSLYARALGTDGYGAAFWNGYPDVQGTLADGAYFGFAAPAPLLVLLLVALAVAGFARAVPGALQRVGLLIALVWAIGLAALFVVAELLAQWSGDIVSLLRDVSPGGIIFFLASLIVLIGSLTRLAKS
jgi:hypothetical protein